MISIEPGQMEVLKKFEAEMKKEAAYEVDAGTLAYTLHIRYIEEGRLGGRAGTRPPSSPLRTSPPYLASAPPLPGCGG